MVRTSLVIALFVMASTAASGSFTAAMAQKPVSQGTVVTETAVIQAIDSTNRLVTLKNQDGSVDTVYCGPEVQRFDALKVGDKVTFRYYESMVYAISAPGAAKQPTDSTSMVRSTTDKPGATIARQQTAVVTVMAIDANVPSVTITTADGSKMSFKVADKKTLTGYKVGDKVQITYTQAIGVSVAASK